MLYNVCPKDVAEDEKFEFVSPIVSKIESQLSIMDPFTL